MVNVFFCTLKIKIIVVLTMVFFYLPLSAQTTYEAVSAGNWSSALTWNGGNIPPIANSGHGVLIRMQGSDKNIDLSNSILVTDGNVYNFEINSGVLSIYGDVSINGNCSMTSQGSGKIKIYGNLNLANANIVSSNSIEVVGNVNISGTGSLNINGGAFVVHGNYTSAGAINITPDAVIAVQGTFEGHLVSYNGSGNLYVGTNSYNLIAPVPPQAVCTPSYSGPNTSTDCPVGDFVDFSVRCPDIYGTYFGSTTLTSFTVSGTNYCNGNGIVTLSGSTAGINYQLYRNGVYTGVQQTGAGSALSFIVSTVGNYSIRATNGVLWRFMNGSMLITNGTTPGFSAIANGQTCGAVTVALNVTPNPVGSTVYWYTTASGGTSIATGTTYSPSISSSTTYYVEAVNGGCTSVRSSVTATVLEKPVAQNITHN
jgi:hypothetical protein